MRHRGRLLIFLCMLSMLGLAMAAGPERLVERTAAILRAWEPKVVARDRTPTAPEPQLELVEGRDNTLRVPDEVARTLGLRSVPAQSPRVSRALVLSGSLALDTNRLAHVHTRFAGEVVELGTITEPGATEGRPVQFGDRVEKGQLLAVLWSADLGETKSEYVDALSRLRMEAETLHRLESLFRDSAIPERNLREARRAVESAEIAVARCERTLRSWRLTEAEIGAIRAEAQRVREPGLRRDREREQSWARVELRAPLTGTILEQNLAVGDIVGTAVDLFKIADLSTLRVWAYVYEEDLPALLDLPRPISWTVRLKADPQTPPIPGTVERVGDLIDPNQHTALVLGQVANSTGRLRAGQFITVTIDLPPTPGEVEVPMAALVEDGTESVVFTQPEGDQSVFSLRRVAVTRRSGGSAYLCGVTGGSGPEAVHPGERVVTAGAVELKAALLGLRAATKVAR